MLSPWRTALTEYLRTAALPIEKYGHQPRLYALTQQISEQLEEKPNDDILFAAAFLHDLGVFIGHRPEDPILLAQWDNTAYALTKAPAILTDLGFPAEKIPAVLATIRTHQPHAEPEALEATILRDADILEQLGAIGITRTLAKIGRDTRFHTFSDAAASLHRALTDLPGQLRLAPAIALAAPRVALHQAFLTALETESGPHLH